MKDGPQFVIDVMVTYQLIGNPEFWKAAPPFLLDDIRESAAEAYEKAVQLAMGQSCTGCNSIRAVLIDTHNEIGRRFASIQRVLDDTDGLLPFIDLISRKRGYRPRAILMYYKDVESRMQTLTL